MTAAQIPNDVAVEHAVTHTFGEFFPDGSLVEPVASRQGDGLELLFKSGKKARIARKIEHLGRIYQAQPLHDNFLGLMHFPRTLASYGGIRSLFAEVVKVLQKYAALPSVQAELATFWVIASWFSDCLFAPPLLWICGPDMYRAMALLSLLQCVCRRGLVYAGFSPSQLPSLPPLLRPTLLVNAAGQSSRRLHLFMESNFRGSVVPGNAGRIADVTCAKAIYAATQDLPEPWGSHALSLVLSSLDDNALSPTEQTRAELADYFQPRLFKYRLTYLQEVRDSQFDVAGLRSPSRGIARSLGACIQGDEALALEVAALLRAQDDDAFQPCTVETAIVEILWPHLHPKDDMAPLSEMKMEEEFTKDVNTFLRASGEIMTFSAVEIGKKVAELNLTRKRKNSGRFLVLDRETCRRVHRLARNTGAGRNVPGCQDCKEFGGWVAGAVAADREQLSTSTV